MNFFKQNCCLKAFQNVNKAIAVGLEMYVALVCYIAKVQTTLVTLIGGACLQPPAMTLAEELAFASAARKRLQQASW